MSNVNEGAANQPAVAAAMDIGSNSIKMTIGRPTADGGVEEIGWDSETVRLGQGVDESGRLAQDRIEAATATLRRFADAARAAGASRLIGVATEATRAAENGPAFLASIRDEIGIEIEAITGDREAELTFLGLAGIVDLAGDVVVADIGGGSTELIVARDEAVRWSRSLPLGSGRLTERFVTHDPPLPGELAECRETARATIAGSPIDVGPTGRLIVVGGTGEYLERLVPATTPRDVAALDAVVDRLTTIDAATLARLIGASEARARVLPAGVAIARAAADVSRAGAFLAAQSGIRRGILIAVFAGEM